ncbi:DNA-dependent metalloprotease WSS1, partial [Lecanoromycetidae sp. Uapishka_2]
MAAATKAASPIPSPPSSDSPEQLKITFTHHATSHTFTFSPESSITDLSNRISDELLIPSSNQKFMITPKLGILKPPFASPSLPLSSLLSKKIVLLAPTPGELSALSSAPRPSPRAPNTVAKPATPFRHRDWQKVQDEATYTFQTLLPLQYLPNPDRSLKFLERLRNDPGIKASMRKHKFSVGVLTEMNPAEHTTHESKTLGLNRNRGEVIELRLRTDAYDGYRDYKVIRDTLCHELAHNVWGEHDRNFWDLCKDIEKEVKAADWTSGGRAVSNEVFYEPQDREGSGGHVDGGGWTGGNFVLGGSGPGSKAPTQTLDRREAIAKAAEERSRKERDARSGGSGASA